MKHLKTIEDVLKTAIKEIIKESVIENSSINDNLIAVDVLSKETITESLMNDILKNVSKNLDDTFYKYGLFVKNVSGVFSEEDLKDKTISRIEILYFENKADKEKYEEEYKLALEKDHRKLGQQLDLFTFSPLVGSGLPLYTPKGTTIRNILLKKVEEIAMRYGAMPVSIPHIAKKDLYDTSGHSEKFGEELLKVISKYDEFILKPVNCPHHTQLFASKIRSYKDLPIRYIESTLQYRDEKPGEIGGLTRVRAITLDDGHVFCSVGQIKKEAEDIVKMIQEFHQLVGLQDDDKSNYWVSLSVRDKSTPEKYIGEDKDWDEAEKMLQEISDETNLDAKICEGEAALYGPKLDFMFKDSLGRETQLSTIQIDFAMPKRFELNYIDEDGKKKTPVMIHRAILGSFERILAILLEHYAGWLPPFIAPVQVVIIPVSKTFVSTCEELVEKLKAEARKEIRIETLDGTESLGKSIQLSKNQKIPFAIVVGETEKKNNTYKIQNLKTGEDVAEGGLEVIKEFLAKL